MGDRYEFPGHGRRSQTFELRVLYSESEATRKAAETTSERYYEEECRRLHAIVEIQRCALERYAAGYGDSPYDGTDLAWAAIDEVRAINWKAANPRAPSNLSYLDKWRHRYPEYGG